MRWQGLLAAVLVAAGLAGCLGSPDPGVDPQSTGSAEAALSQPEHEIREVEEIRVPTSADGKTMEVAVYRPATDEPVPAFINFSPYWGDTADERGDAFARYMIDRYVPRGYAVVLASIRGTGESEGCFQIAGDKELADLNDVVDHVAGADWSNGKVLAGGKSYDSTPQNGMIAKDPHPALEGLFHVSGISDMYRYTYHNGVPYAHGAIFNTYYYGQSTHEYGIPAPLLGGAPDQAASPEDEDAASAARAVDDVACPELPETQAHGLGSGVHGMKTDYWTERDWNRHVPDTDWNGSIFFVHGLQDWNVKPDHILPWLERLPDRIDVKGWLHQDTQDNTGHVYPMRADWNRTMLAWMDHELKDKPVAVDWTVQAEGTDGVWREADAWPPADGPRQAHEVDVQPADGAIEGSPEGVVVEADEALRYAGAPTLTVTATSTSPDPVITATLYEEDGSGERVWQNQALLRGAYRDGLAEPDPVPVGEPVTYEVDMFPQDDVLEPGHRWVLTLGEYPRFGVPTPAQLEAVSYDPDSVTLELPLAPLDTDLADQPEPTPCHTC